MNEDLLSFIWRFQYFEKQHLTTDEHQTLSIINPGRRNNDAGPDFLEARVVLEDVTWVGNIEIHCRSSDWLMHGHDQNKAYDNVILHVVWENDQPIVRHDGTNLPTLTLKSLVDATIFIRYSRLQDEKQGIPCASSFSEVDEIRKLSMLDKVLLQRLSRKAAEVLSMLSWHANDWDETSYRWLTTHFGFKLNDPAFRRLSEILPWKILRKHRDKLMQMEALLFGCAGLIPAHSGEPYIRQLTQEFHFLSNKYKLSDRCMGAHEWKYARLHPAGFPTVRIAQLAQILSHEENLFSRFRAAGSIDDLMHIFQARQSLYWTEHYVFGKKSKAPVPQLGRDAASLLIINGVVPLLAAYGKYRTDPDLLEKAVYFLSRLPAENNRITREWKILGMNVKNAADSQALIEWYNLFCNSKKCLECTVGAALIRPSS